MQLEAENKQKRERKPKETSTMLGAKGKRGGAAKGKGPAGRGLQRSNTLTRQMGGAMMAAEDQVNHAADQASSLVHAGCAVATHQAGSAAHMAKNLLHMGGGPPDMVESQRLPKPKDGKGSWQHV